MTQDERAAWLVDTCQKIVKIRKSAKADPAIGRRFARLYRGDKIPEYYEGYREAVEIYRAGKLHAFGEFPRELFDKIKPNQREEDYKYLEAIYEAITKDVYLEFGNTCKKSLVNGSIEFPQIEDGNPLQDYLNNGIENFDSIIGWAAAMVDTKILDGMGIVGAWPMNIVTNDGGELISEIQAQPVLYPVPMLVYAENSHEGAHYIVESKHKSDVMYGGQMKRMGYTYRYFGPDFIAEAKQVGKESDDQFEVVFILEHEIGYTPATRLEGIARLVETEVYYDSVFSLAVPHLNNAVIDNTGLSAVKQKVMYPTRVMVAQKCNYQEGGSMCNAGEIEYFDNDKGQSIRKTCSNCQGSGYVGVVGPMSEIRVNVDSQIGEEKSSLSALNVMTYVAPSVDAPKFIREEVEHHLKMAQQTLHLKSEPRQSGSITATEKDRDKENTEAFIKPISDQIWRKIEFVVEVIGKMMFAERYDTYKPTIHKAETFDIVSSAELGEMIAEAKKVGMPGFIVQQMAEDYVNLMQTTSAKADQIAKLLVSSDRLLVLSDLEIQARLARNLVERWEVYYHDNQTFIIEAVYADNDDLFDRPMGEQLQLIQAKAIEKLPATPSLLPPPIDPGA